MRYVYSFFNRFSKKIITFTWPKSTWKNIRKNIYNKIPTTVSHRTFRPILSRVRLMLHSRVTVPFPTEIQKIDEKTKTRITLRNVATTSSKPNVNQLASKLVCQSSHTSIRRSQKKAKYNRRIRDLHYINLINWSTFSFRSVFELFRFVSFRPTARRRLCTTAVRGSYKNDRPFALPLIIEW